MFWLTSFALLFQTARVPLSPRLSSQQVYSSLSEARMLTAWFQRPLARREVGKMNALASKHTHAPRCSPRAKSSWRILKISQPKSHLRFLSSGGSHCHLWPLEKNHLRVLPQTLFTAHIIDRDSILICRILLLLPGCCYVIAMVFCLVSRVLLNRWLLGSLLLLGVAMQLAVL